MIDKKGSESRQSSSTEMGKRISRIGILDWILSKQWSSGIPKIQFKMKVLRSFWFKTRQWKSDDSYITVTFETFANGLQITNLQSWKRKHNISQLMKLFIEAILRFTLHLVIVLYSPHIITVWVCVKMVTCWRQQRLTLAVTYLNSPECG